MRLGRASGLLLHPTSLPGSHGSGDLGDGAVHLLDFLAAARQRLWQVLPLGPTGYGDSPYQSFSAFAGNPLLISPDRLVEEDLLDAADLAAAPDHAADQVDYGAVIPTRWQQVRASRARFTATAAPELRRAFEEFRAGAAGWLDDYALFMALKEAHGGAPWYDWPPALRRREPAALDRARAELAEAIHLQQYAQWLFARQWAAVRAHAAARGVRIVGDLPIFVADDSADVWASPALFHLDAAGRPTVVAGVPPDYFSATGQLWGNPLYRWEALAATGYAWWVRRFQAAFALVDIVRIDHFRGFESYWEVPAGEPTAINGRWVPGPGAALFAAVRAALGELPIIAEDLGLITPPVAALREGQGFPGMAVLQFAFGGGADNAYLPHNHHPNLVVYTGTHDNDTTTGWYATAGEGERDHLRRYLSRDGRDVAWDLIRAALASVADTAIVPLQDVLGRGSEARMNRPGRLGGNWGWRYRREMLTAALAARLADLTTLYGRDGNTAAAGIQSEISPAALS